MAQLLTMNGLAVLHTLGLWAWGGVLLLAALGLAAVVHWLRHGPIEDRGANVLWRLNRAFARTWHGLRWDGEANIPRQGPVILASNHTTGLDPLLIQAACRRPIRWVMLTAHHFPALNFVWKRINPIALERGTGDRAKIRQIVAALQQGDIVGFFPEGGLQRTHRELQKLQPGIAMLAQRSGAWVVPVWIEGTPRRRSMLWHFLQPSRSRVRFGEPFRAQPDQPHKAFLAELRQRMLALSEPTPSPGS